MHRIVPIVALALCSCSPVGAPVRDTSPPVEFDSECGDPRAESTAWRLLAGTVVEIVDGDSIVVQTGGTRRRIDLAAVDASDADDAARAALARLLNHAVDVAVSFDQPDRSGVGVVHAQRRDINRELLATGAARYREPVAYTMSNYTACVYRIVERQARDAQRGLWRHASR